MEVTKKKKRPKSRSGQDEAHTSTSVSSSNLLQARMNENLILDCVEEVVMNIDSHDIGISVNTTDSRASQNERSVDISLQHVGLGENHELNEKILNTGIQETNLTEVLGTLPTAPILEELGEPPLPTQVFKNSKEPTSSYTYMKFRQGYMPLSETSLLRLYVNDKLKSYEGEYKMPEESLSEYHKHCFYENVNTFLKVHRAMYTNGNLLENKKSQLRIQIEKVWDTEKKNIVETGECQDGNPVCAELDYSIHHFNQGCYEVFSQALNELKEQLHTEVVKTNHNAELLRQSISRYIEGLCNSCIQNLTTDSPVQLLMDSEQAVIKDYVLEVRICIGILFKFQQYKLFCSDTYSNFLKIWLTKLVQVLLKIGVKQDHIFILHQVLRIQRRIPDWIKQFIQIPLPDLKTLHSPFDSPHLAHLINILSILMHPVQKHPISNEGELDIALDMKNDDPDASWVLVDSDGEDECRSGQLISVNDIIDLFNQLPLEQMYASILKIDKVDKRYCLDLSQYDDRYMIELFAFCTVLVKEFKLGLQTYSTLNYQQFAKRLGQLIKHTVQYVTDVYERYIEVNGGVNNSSIWPLQCEYDMFFMRCVNAIYSSHNMGIWQFLATLPYHKISTSALWQIYGLLHKQYGDNLDVDLPSDVNEWEMFIKQSPVLIEFEDRLCVLQESESIYLLTAFSFMAVPTKQLDESRNDFIRIVALNLFQVGFMCESTQDRFNKHIRTLLSSITGQYPNLISCILKQMPHYNFVDTESSCLDLFRDLPLASWVPNDEDLEIIRRWLLDRPLLSTEFSLARLILANLNYNAYEGETADQDLFLSHKFHCKVGLLVVEAALRSVPDQPSSASSSTAALCDMVLKYVTPSSGLEVIMKWGWRVLSQLRIHSIDRGGTVPRDTISSPEILLQSIPDLYGHDNLQVIATAVLRSQPIACYLAVLMSTLGHNVPLICSKGLPLVDLLVRNQCYREALKCIYLLVPMFLECPESLVQCDVFHTIIITMFGADKSFLKLGKPFSSNPDFPGFHLRQLGNLINVHLLEAKNLRYGLNAFKSMICLWLQCLAKIPDWVNDPSAVYLMDIVLQEAFSTKETYEEATRVLGLMYMMKMPGQTNPPDSSNPCINVRPEYSAVEMFLQFQTRRSYPQLQSLMSKVSLPTTPWFALFVLTIERDWQRSSQTWQAMQLELYDQSGRTNIDAAFKKALQNSDVPISMPAGSLAIYRLAHQALDTPVQHRILPYLWQMFFTLYLARVPADPSGSKGGVGHKFFEGTVGQNLIKRIKKQLLDTAAHYTVLESQLRDESKDDPTLQRVNHGEIVRLSICSKLFKTFHLWLEDQRLMDSNVILANLEPMYDIPKLRAIFEGDECIWGEFLSEKQYVDTHIKHWNEWQKLNYRYQEPNRNVYGSSERRTISTMENTWKRLSSYESPVRFEEVVTDPQPIFPAVPSEVMLYKENLLVFVNEQLDILSNIGQLYMQTLAEHTALDCAVLEFLPSLYNNIETEKVLSAECHSSPPHRGSEYHARQSTCAGPAEIRVIVTESQLNPAVSESIAENRSEWMDVIRRVLRPPRYETCSTIATVDLLVMNLIKDYNEACNNMKHQRKIVVKELSVSLFFHLVENYNESLCFFPPTETMMHTWLTSLAEPFIMNGAYVEQLLIALLEKPCLVPILSAYLMPVEATPSTFLALYELVAKKAYESQPDERTYAELLSRFPVDEWLKRHRTSFAERSTLIDEVMMAIEAAGLQPDPRHEKVHAIIRKHFVTLLHYDFPGHFGKILSLLLRGSAVQRISVDVWYDFINALFGDKRVSLGDEMSKLKEEIRLFATEQKLLSHSELLQTIHLLGRYFLVERNMYGLYGLYPKYRTYVEPIMIFQAMINHSYIVSELSTNQGALSSLICEKVWPAVDEVFSPWIAPLQTEHMAEPPAAWIDQLAEDRSVLLPWIPPDLLHANKAVMMFIETTRFILDTVSGEILSHLWQYYVAKFVHKSITENVLSVIQNHMELLPWQLFRPRLEDMDIMYKVIMQSVPAEVYTFLGTIFVKVAWLPWLSNMIHIYKDNYDVQSRLHVYLLHLHVKLSKDNDVRKWSKVTEMLVTAKKFDWQFVDAVSYAQVVDWWVFKYDPKVAAGLGDPYVNPIDICVMKLLEIAAGFSTEVHLHPAALHKRILFVRGKVKMLIKCSYERTFIEKNVNDVSLTLVALLTLIENVVQRTVKEENRLEECSLLVKEVVVIFNQPENNELRKVALKVCSAWLTKENSMSIVVQGFLRVVGTDVTNSSTMGHLLEICLDSYFKHTVMQVTHPNWTTAAQLMSSPMVPNIEETLLTGGYFLTLHAILYQQISCTKSLREEVALLSNLVDWICQLKPITIEESKLPLLWGVALLLIDRQCQNSDNVLSVTRSIKRLITHFLELGEEKGQLWNFLGNFGIRKQLNLSPKGRFMCRAIAVFLLAQLPECGGEEVTIRMGANAPGAITGSSESSEGVIVPKPSEPALRGLRDLEANTSSKSFGELKDTLELAVKLIKDPSQSILTARQFLGAITSELYNDQYLYILVQ